MKKFENDKVELKRFSGGIVLGGTNCSSAKTENDDEIHKIFCADVYAWIDAK